MATIISQSISDVEMERLKHDIYDINNSSNPLSLWVSGSITGKINNCYKRIQSEWIPKLIADSSVNAISASRDEFGVNTIYNTSLSIGKMNEDKTGYYAVAAETKDVILIEKEWAEKILSFITK